MAVLNPRNVRADEPGRPFDVTLTQVLRFADFS